MIWGSGIRNLQESDVNDIMDEIISSRDSLYANYRNLLAEKQYKLLKSIGTEGNVVKPLSGDFIKKYNLGTASTVASSLNTLIEKDLIYKEKHEYRLYDVFQSKWFQRVF